MMAGDACNLFMLGITYGMTVCSLTCLPYLGPFLAGTGGGFRDGCGSVITFFVGKTFTYTVLGGLAASFGQSMHTNAMGKTVMAAVIICTALTIPLFSSAQCGRTLRQSGKRLSFFAIGGISGLVPCPPLAAVLLLAASQTTILAGAACGLSFGCGLAVSPAIPLGGLLSFVSAGVTREVATFAPYLRFVSMAIMVLAGIRVMM